MKEGVAHGTLLKATKHIREKKDTMKCLLKSNDC
jgi:hypothetical protein